MKFFSKCEGCRKKKFLIRRCVVELKDVGPIRSQGEMCGKCRRAIKKMVRG